MNSSPGLTLNKRAGDCKGPQFCADSPLGPHAHDNSALASLVAVCQYPSLEGLTLGSPGWP